MGLLALLALVAVACAGMRIEIPIETEPLVRVVTYMYPRQRQALRVLAAKHGMAMSEYLKHLIDQAAKEDE